MRGAVLLWASLTRATGDSWWLRSRVRGGSALGCVEAQAPKADVLGLGFLSSPFTRSLAVPCPALPGSQLSGVGLTEGTR